MKQNQKILYLYTSKFPYGDQEVFIHNELRYLSKHYDKIIITPLFPDTRCIYKLDQNIIVNNSLLPPSNLLRILSIIFIKRKILKAYIIDFKEKKTYRKYRWMVKWLKSYINTNYLYRHHHKKIENISNGIVYFYWTSSIVNILPFINKNPNVVYVTRLHGGDIYLNRSNGYSPIKKKVLNSVDYFLPISKDIKNYLMSIYSIPEGKIFINRLGSAKHIENTPVENNKLLRVVSCSSIIKIKRVEMIIDILKHIEDELVEWHHFGDGVLQEDIIRKSKSLPKNIKAIFHGRVNNYNILENYSNIYYDVFINVSKHEGVPVSIMEAMSYGIPVIATDVGAVNEIVNNENGLLIDKNFDSFEVAKTIMSIKGDKWRNKRENAYSFWRDNYNLVQNTSELVRFFETLLK